ncbi:MAG: hypothetical protein A2202_01745 [Bdellovibrionales bacterium RIFOXYA1_FULL_36_14]|nr:MAG: hypothetical protein A2202_01745 [Bdellovibrionales bacterium RIFOXYA1_FULL_36_14]
MIYLDYAASSPVKEAAIKVLMHSTVNDFANPSSNHQLGLDLTNKINLIREKMLNLLGIKRGYRVIFVSSATEANNLVIRGLAIKKGDHILISPTDHPSIKVPSYQLMREGINVDALEHDEEGLIDEKHLFEKTFLKEKLLALSYVHNQSGHIFQIDNMVKKIKEHNKNIHIHVDGVQAAGKININMRDMLIDSLTISSHKMGGPKGIAALILRENVDLHPLILGGGQEYSLRSSTLAAPLIFAFFAAFCEAMEKKDELNLKLSNLKDYIMENLPKQCPEVIFPFAKAITSHHILMMIFPKIKSDILIRHLEMKKIYVSTSSACSSKNNKDNEVFTHLKIKSAYHQNVIRLSMGDETTLEEIQTFINEISLIHQDLIGIGVR